MMRLTIESTDRITHFNDVPCRLWKGTTDQGIPCLLFVYRIAAAKGQDTTEFDRTLKEQLPLSRYYVPLSQIL